MWLAFSEWNASNIEAGKPYIVKWDRKIEDDLPNPVFINATISSTPSNVSTDEVVFEGCFSPVTIDGENRKMLYLGENNKLYYPSSNMAINSFRTYFKLQGDLICGEPQSSGEVNNFALNFGGNMETGISLTSTPSTLSSDSWYTLDGRKLSGKPTSKGIYINHGKKIVLR